MATKVKYPIGEQSFEQLRKGGYLYVDKTPFIEKLIEGPKYYFLGRPRRFGKSLFINTLKCFFEGKRELFKGLYIDSIDWDWEEYPVFRLDLNTRRFQDDANLHDENSGVFVYELQDEIVRGEVDAFMKRLRSLFSDTSYELRMDEELNVQNALFILFKLIGIYVDAEYRTSEGRIDILLRTNDYVYIMELKYDKSAREALDQIERKGYALPWSIDDRKIIAIGINISKSKRTIDEWVSKTINP